MPVQAVVSLPYTTNLPRDVAQTTWAFRTEDLETETLLGIGDAMIEFFNANVASTSRSVGFFHSALIDRPRCTVSLYDISETPMGPPISIRTFPLSGPGSQTQMPLEVALCNSFQGDPIGSMSQRRRRGRTYMGPLNIEAQRSGSGLPRPSDLFMDTLQGASFRLMESAREIDGVEWCVWSRSSDILVPITNGWINNEWDTQRRREGPETARVIWQQAEP